MREQIAALTHLLWLTISAHLLTLDNEVDIGETWLVIGLEAAGVRPLVRYLHIFNVNGEVAAVVIDQCHTLVQCPFVSSCEKDVWAIQPGFVGHILVNPTSERREEETSRQVKTSSGWELTAFLAFKNIQHFSVKQSNHNLHDQSTSLIRDK